MFQKAIDKLKFAFLMVCLSVFSLFMTVSPSVAALDADVEAMFTAVDMADLKTKVAALLMATLLIPLLFVGARLVKRGIRSAGS
ncbi:hypothetical protein [Trichlorobacter ammonificans]|uniref:Phage coat protein n=1 Tax=Trichlorobacter ammonificans TaxID=2916410 RepID=A0ABN8HJC6_9BACT|nr:hypothetical protein [Trichlorobacter ammonificans]CAH2032102.1 exported protein of unknown function [Trichlorobacter ammonificans]